MPSFPPKKIDIVVITVLSNYIVTAGHCKHTVILLKIVSQNAPNCISAHIHFKNFGEGACPWTMTLDHPRELVAFGHSVLLPQTINPR